MKRITTVIMLLTGLSIFFSGCGDNSKKIIGTWTGVGLKNIDGYEALSDYDENINSVVTFTKKYDCAVDFGLYENEERTGTWKNVPTTKEDVEFMYDVTIDGDTIKCYFLKDSDSTLVMEVGNYCILFTKDGSCINHFWNEATCIAPRTCSICGETVGNVSEHNFTEATCIDPQTCSICGETVGDPLGHDWGELTCSEPQECSRCDMTGKQLEHQYKVIEERKSTLFQYGSKEVRCSKCGYTTTERINKEYVDVQKKHFNCTIDEFISWIEDYFSSDEIGERTIDKNGDLCIDIDDRVTAVTIIISADENQFINSITARIEADYFNQNHDDARFIEKIAYEIIPIDIFLESWCENSHFPIYGCDYVGSQIVWNEEYTFDTLNVRCRRWSDDDFRYSIIEAI